MCMGEFYKLSKNRDIFYKLDKMRERRAEDLARFRCIKNEKGLGERRDKGDRGIHLKNLFVSKYAGAIDNKYSQIKG